MSDNIENNNQNMVTVYIDDQAYQVSSDNNLLAGVLSQKLNLPYFCWHPSMGSVGACRQCAVTQYQDENDTRGRMVMACTTPVTDGMRIRLKDKSSTVFREQVISAMMTNHPHDCPVCAEGGECHLQDMTVMTGHSTREYKGDKRTFTNQHLGEFVGHEMNRCITCYRCVRFYKDYAGGDDFGVYGSKNNVYFGRQQDGQLESEFSGNLVEVCPTGVFTNKLFSAHYTRKWDLQSAPSICSHCAVGCNTSVGERYGSVRRVMNRYSHDINGYFLCDRGRFGIGFVNGEQRIREAKGISQQSPERLSSLDVAKALVHHKGKRFIGIGSARASFEANYYLKNLVGDNHFSLGWSADEMNIAASHKSFLAKNIAPSLHEIEQSDFVLILDEDITHTAPRMALAVRQALRNASIDKADLLGIPSWQDSAVRTIGGTSLTPLYLIQSHASKLDDVAEQVILQKTKATIAFVNELTEMLNTHEDVICFEHQHSSLLNQLLQAKKPLIIGGWGSHSAELVSAISEFVESLKQSKYFENSSLKCLLVPPQANSVGLLSLMDQQSLSVEQVLSSIEAGADSAENVQGIEGIIFLEQELEQFNPQQLLALKQSSLTVIALEHSENKITEVADIVLPVAAVTEGDGHFVNYQGRIQPYYQVHPSVLPIQENWRWLGLLAKAIYPKHALAKEAKTLHELYQLFLQQDSHWPIRVNEADSATARETHRNSGRTAKMANNSVHEVKTTQSQDHYRYSMEGDKPQNSDNMPFTWAPGWNSNQGIHQYQQHVGGELISQSADDITQQTLNFTDVPALKPCWSNQSNDGREENTPTVERNFFLQRPWHREEWQASFTPEFILVEHVNAVVISKSMAEDNHWVAGQWLSASLLDDHENQILNTITQVFIDERISDDLIYGEFDCSANHQVKDISLSTATDEQVIDYQNRLEQQKQAAKSQQQQILVRLKQQDQYIPIRLVAGGLDDA